MQPSATFVVAPKPPEVFIESPTSGSRYAWGMNVTLNGSAYDLQGGWLYSDVALVWTSGRDGTLGSGRTLNLNNLSPGQHTITLSATNGFNLTTSTSVTVTIGIKGDVNGDGCVQADDLTTIASVWRQGADPPFDLDGDRKVTVIDIEMAAVAWGCH